MPADQKDESSVARPVVVAISTVAGAGQISIAPAQRLAPLLAE
jgi:hypothetical protein